MDAAARFELIGKVSGGASSDNKRGLTLAGTPSGYISVFLLHFLVLSFLHNTTHLAFSEVEQRFAV
jgi:hypothetical protein